MKLSLWKDSIRGTLSSRNQASNSKRVTKFCSSRHFFSVLVILTGFVGMSIGCDDNAEANAKQRIKNDQGYRTYSTDTGLVNGFDWSRTGNIVAGGPVGYYTLQFIGYPYNRMNLIGKNVYTGEGNREEPIALVSGEYIPLEVHVGSETRAYNFQIAQLPSQPIGTYLLDSHGAMEDIVSLAASWPGSPISFTLRGDTSGGQAGSAIPLAFRDPQGAGMQFCTTITVPGDLAPEISTIPVTRAGIQIKND